MSLPQGIPEGFLFEKAEFVAEEVKDVLALQVNGEDCGVRAFAPFTLDITSCVKSGKNHVRLEITNTLINALRSMPKMSGIYGKTGILITKKH